MTWIQWVHRGLTGRRVIEVERYHQLLTVGSAVASLVTKARRLIDAAIRATSNVLTRALTATGTVSSTAAATCRRVHATVILDRVVWRHAIG